MSNTLLKSNDMTITTGFVRRLSVIWLHSLVISVAGDPVGLKNDNDGGDDRKAEKRELCTMIHSITLVLV